MCSAACSHGETVVVSLSTVSDSFKRTQVPFHSRMIKGGFPRNPSLPTLDSRDVTPESRPCLTAAGSSFLLRLLRLSHPWRNTLLCQARFIETERTPIDMLCCYMLCPAPARECMTTECFLNFRFLFTIIKAYFLLLVFSFLYPA